MAREYTFYGAADTTSEHFRSVIAGAVGGSAGADGTIFVDGMYISAFSVDSAEKHSITRLFGFEHRVTAIFRFDNMSTPSIAEHNTVLMAIAVLAVFDAYAKPGVLLFNGEEAILQRLDDGVVFDAEWEEWAEIPDVGALMAAHSKRRLPQPLL